MYVIDRDIYHYKKNQNEINLYSNFFIHRFQLDVASILQLIDPQFSETNLDAHSLSIQSQHLTTIFLIVNGHVFCEKQRTKRVGKEKVHQSFAAMSMHHFLLFTVYFSIFFL
jgi:hypothetical protein